MYPGKWAEVSPDKPAVIHSVSGEQTTWRELNDRSNQLAQLLYSKGLRRGDHIAMFMENDIRFYDVVWAALRSGLYLTTVNRYLTAEEAGYIVDNCEAKALISSAYLGDTAKEILPHAPNCKTNLVVRTVLAPPVDPRASNASCPVGLSAPKTLVPAHCTK